MTLVLGTIPWLGWTPFFAVKEKFITDDKDLRIRLYTENIDQFFVLSKGWTNLNTLMAGDVVMLISKGFPIKILLETSQSEGGDMVIIKKNYRDLSELKGKRIGLDPDTAHLFLLKKALEAYNLKLEDVKLIPTTPATGPKLFIDDGVEALVTWAPFDELAIKNGNGKVGFRCPGKIIPEVLVGLKKTISEDRDSVLKLIRAWYKAVEWSSKPENEMEYYDIVNRGAFNSKLPLQEFRRCRSLAKVLTKAESESKIKELTDYCIEITDFYIERGILKKRVDPSEYLDFDLLKRA